MVEIEPTRLEAWMDAALGEARAALTHGDVPVGAVVVDLTSDRIVAARHNERELTNDPTAHAELLALRDAAAAAGGGGSTTTCSSSRSSRARCARARCGPRASPLVVFGAADPKAGAAGSLYNFAADPRLNHDDRGRARACAPAECAALLTEFFASRRGASARSP